MFDFNNVKLIDDNNLNSVEREFLINSFLTLENLPKIFKLLYNVDIKISEDPIYLIDDYNHDKPIYKIINVNGDLLSNILSVKKYNLNIQKGMKSLNLLIAILKLYILIRVIHLMILLSV